MDTFEIGVSYTLSTYSPGVLGDFTEVTAQASKVSYHMASKVDPTINTTHAQVWSELPKGTPESASELTYVSFTNAQGKDIVLATAWIIMNSVQVSENRQLVATILDEGQASIDRLRRGLAELGFKVGDIKVI